MNNAMEGIKLGYNVSAFKNSESSLIGPLIAEATSVAALTVF